MSFIEICLNFKVAKKTFGKTEGNQKSSYLFLKNEKKSM